MAWAERTGQGRVVPNTEMFSPTIAPVGQAKPLLSVRRPKAAFLLDPASRDLIYGQEEITEIRQLTDLSDEVIPFRNWIKHVDILADAEVIFSGWSAPLMDERFLKAAPRLRAVFYGAGSVRYFATPEMWERGIIVTSASSANAIPVAEYTVGTVLLSMRHFWAKAAEAREGKGWGDHTRPIPGSFRASIGLLSFGTIGRTVARLLRSYDVKVLVHCPYLQADEAVTLGVERVGLEELFKRSDVLSVHTPVLSETLGMVNGELVASMKKGATLINTARGVILAQREVEEVLRRRPDLHAVLDVTDPEPPAKGDSLLALPNVTVTSHIAGSHGRDCQRMGHYMLEELKNYLAGRPLRWQVTPALLERMA